MDDHVGTPRFFRPFVVVFAVPLRRSLGVLLAFRRIGPVVMDALDAPSLPPQDARHRAGVELNLLVSPPFAVAVVHDFNADAASVAGAAVLVAAGTSVVARSRRNQIHLGLTGDEQRCD